nr:hypothetical protein [Tanacetum cinerariifolium]
MLNEENYVPWSSRLLRYAKSRPNGKLIYNSIINGPYDKRMIPKLGDPNREVTVNETFHVQTNDELTKKELKQIEADDQAIQTILLDLPKGIYAAVDSCETALEIWLRVQQMMEGSDIGIQEKKAKLFNEWERFTSTDGESIESYYHRFLKLMSDLKRNKHFPEKIASNLKFLNNLQPEWSQHVTIVHQTKDLHIADYTQLYDFLKYNQKENYMQQPMPNSEDITDPTTAINMALALIAKAFKLNYSTPTNNNQRISSNPCNWQIAQPDLDEIEEVNANFILMANLQQASTSGTQTDKAPVYDSDGAAEVHNYEVFYDNEIFNTFTQEEQYTELLKPILKSHQVPQNDNNVISEIVENMNGLSVVSKIANYGNRNVVTSPVEGNGNGINGNPIRCYNCQGLGHYASNCTVNQRKRDAAYLQQQLQIAQEEEVGIQSTQEEFEFMDTANAYEENKRVKANCILENNLQQASTSSTQSDKAPYTELLEPIPEPHEVPQNDSNVISKVSSVEQGGGTVEQHPKLENENVELDFQVLNYAKENAHLKTTYKNLFDFISVTQTQTKTIIDSLQTKLHDMIYENAKLRAQLFDKVFEQKDSTRGMSANTKFAKQSILGKPPSSSRTKLYAVTPLPKSTAFTKVGEMHALSKPVTLNSVPTLTKSKVMKNDNVISPGIFRINPFKASMVDNFVPNKHVKASVRTKPITAAQPHVITKNDVNSKTNRFSPKDDKSTTRTRRQQPRNNPKNDKVPSKSKSSRLSNNLEKIEENLRNLQSFSNKKHMSSKRNNIKLVIQNDKSEVVCAICKKCLITVNHDVCMLNYVNGMNSRGKKQKENVSNQKKHKAQVWKPKNVGSKERLASPKPSTPRSCLWWSPNGRLFDLKGKIIASSESESQSNYSKSDNACTSNPQEPISRWFPNSIFSMTGGQNWFDTLLILLLSEYKPIDKEDHRDNKCDT